MPDHPMTHAGSLPRSRFHRVYSELHRRLTGRVSEAEYCLRMAELAMDDRRIHLFIDGRQVAEAVARRAGGSDDYRR